MLESKGFCFLLAEPNSAEHHTKSQARNTRNTKQIRIKKVITRVESFFRFFFFDLFGFFVFVAHKKQTNEARGPAVAELHDTEKTASQQASRTLTQCANKRIETHHKSFVTRRRVGKVRMWHHPTDARSRVHWRVKIRTGTQRPARSRATMRRRERHVCT